MNGWGPKSSVCPSKHRETKLFWRDIPGFCRDIPRVPEKFEKKKVCVRFSSPIWSGCARTQKKRFLRKRCFCGDTSRGINRENLDGINGAKFAVFFFFSVVFCRFFAFPQEPRNFQEGFWQRRFLQNPTPRPREQKGPKDIGLGSTFGTQSATA